MLEVSPDDPVTDGLPGRVSFGSQKAPSDSEKVEPRRPIPCASRAEPGPLQWPHEGLCADRCLPQDGAHCVKPDFFQKHF